MTQRNAEDVPLATNSRIVRYNISPFVLYTRINPVVGLGMLDECEQHKPRHHYQQNYQ